VVEPFMNWAFMKVPGRTAKVYAAISEGFDILYRTSRRMAMDTATIMSGLEEAEHLGSREMLAPSNTSGHDW
jgi:hypothetical protein